MNKPESEKRSFVFFFLTSAAGICFYSVLQLPLFDFKSIIVSTKTTSDWVETVMEASRVCPAAGQMRSSPRIPRGATQRLDSKKTGSDFWCFPSTGSQAASVRPPVHISLKTQECLAGGPARRGTLPPRRCAKCDMKHESCRSERVINGEQTLEPVCTHKHAVSHTRGRRQIAGYVVPLTRMQTETCSHAWHRAALVTWPVPQFMKS